ncbi:MAG: RidA family protein [Flavobacteriaceae bacterium]
MKRNPLEQLKALQIELPEVSTPGGSYVSVNIRQNIAYVAIQFPIKNNDYLYQGSLGKERTTEDGYKAMELCALNVLAQINDKVGFDNIIGLNHIDAYYLSSEKWDDAPTVVNGASDMFLKVLGEKGTHSRAIFGVEKLPKNFCVGLSCTFTIKNG